MSPHPLDLAVLVAYALAMVGFGLYFYFRVDRYSDYYYGGRTWGVWIVGCAVAATNIGAGNTMGSVALAYRDGLSAGWYVTLQALAFIPFAYVAVHKIYPLKETTLAEYLEWLEERPDHQPERGPGVQTRDDPFALRIRARHEH